MTVAESLISRLHVARLYIGTPLNPLVAKMNDCNKPLLTFDVEMMLTMCLLCREFIAGNYVDLKRSNLKLLILIRECSGVRPVMFARYGEGLYCVMSLTH